jgi:hypothetical protein
MTSVEQLAYRGAIALNNHGVSLIERQCYEQALATLRDAMLSMSSFRQMGADNHPGDCPFSHPHYPPVDIHSCVKDAALRVANPLVTLPVVTGQMPSDICIQALPGDFTDYRIQPSLMNQMVPRRSSHSILLRPIRIDDLFICPDCCTDHEKCDDFELNAAIVIYNCALANWGNSVMLGAYTCGPSPAVVTKLLENPTIILELVAARCENEYFLRRVMFVNATVLRTLIHWFQEQFAIQATDDPSLQLERLRALYCLEQKLHMLHSCLANIDRALCSITPAIKNAAAA